MKKIKKAAALAVAAALTASNAIVFSASAEKAPLKVSVVPSVSEVKAGEEFEVEVTITDNPGVVAWHFYLGYDDTAFEVTDDPDLESISQTYINDKGKEKTTSASVIAGPIENNPLSFSWNDALYTDYYNTGTVITYYFKAKDDIQPKQYDFELTFDSKDVYGFDYQTSGEDVPCIVTNGSVTVKQAVTGVSVSPKTIEFAKVGDTKKIDAEVIPGNATNKNITFSSDKTSVATVASDGTVTAKGEGTATITATTEDGSFKATVDVSVAHTHTMKEIPAVDPTCQKTGNNKYYQCTGCNKYFKDEAGTEPTTVENEVISKIAHNFTEKSPTDKYLDKAATCVAPATYFYKCTMCDEKGTETYSYGDVDKTNHVGETEVKNYKPATCTEEGYTGDTFCKSCGEKISEGQKIPMKDHVPANDWSYDEENHWKVCTLGCGTILDKAAHSGGTATCVKKAVCEVCGQEYGDVDKDNHLNYTLHNYKPATAEEDGYTGDLICDDCNAVVQEGKVIPKHVHNFELVAAVEPTCTEAGHIAFYMCPDCGAISEDAEGTKIWTEMGDAAKTFEKFGIPALNHEFLETWMNDENQHWHQCIRCDEKADVEDHTWSEWVESVDENGDKVRTKTCTVCGFEVTEVIEPAEESVPVDESESESESESETESESAAESATESVDESQADSTGDTSSSANESNGGSTGDTSKPSGNNKNGNPATGAASAFAVVTAAALGAMFITKRRK
ncbi:MAG: Ig-like domain-containing protein [Ruminococcus sp.]|nr:Ig-like domain-containing protein [Ruminococcus sp.]